MNYLKLELNQKFEGSNPCSKSSMEHVKIFFLYSSGHFNYLKNLNFIF